MKYKAALKIASFSLAVFISGCATHGSSTNADRLLMQDLSISAQPTLRSATPCCEHYNQVPYTIANLNNVPYLISEQSPVMEFTQGRSYLLALAFSDADLGSQITLVSKIGKTVFPAEILLLDGNHQLSRTIHSKDFAQQESSLFSTDRLATQIQLLPNEKYMLVYADQTLIGKHLTVPHPEKLKAKATGYAPAPYPDIEIPYSNWGVIEIAKNGKRLLDGSLLSTQTTASTNASVVPATETVMSNRPEISVQSKHYYQQAIQTAVKEGELEQAMQLVKEAKALGYTDSENVFIQAIKQK